MKPGPLGHALAHPFLCTWLIRDPAYQRPGAGGLWAQLCASAECKYESLSLSEPGLPVREAKVKCAIEFGYGTAGQGGVGVWGGKSLRAQWGHRGVPETCRRAGASK